MRLVIITHNYCVCPKATVDGPVAQTCMSLHVGSPLRGFTFYTAKQQELCMLLDLCLDRVN